MYTVAEKRLAKWVNKVGLETNFVNGLRVTDKDTMEVAEMVLNKVNKGLVSMMEKVGVKAVGISGKDGVSSESGEKAFRWKRHWICRRSQTGEYRASGRLSWIADLFR